MPYCVEVFLILDQEYFMMQRLMNNKCDRRRTLFFIIAKWMKGGTNVNFCKNFYIDGQKLMAMKLEFLKGF